MAKREIMDCFGRSTGERVARYVWRSKPSRSPYTGCAVRALVAQDEKGQYWDATRIGRGEGQKARHEFWLEPSKTKEQAIEMSRQQTREYLSAEAQLFSNTVNDKKPGEQIVKVTMDDGWSMAINEAGKISPAEKKAIAIFERLGKGKPGAPKAPARKSSRDWLSR